MFCETNLIVVECKQQQRRFKVKWKRKNNFRAHYINDWQISCTSDRQMCIKKQEKIFVSEKSVKNKSWIKKKKILFVWIMTQRMKLFYGLLGVVIGLSIGTFLKTFNTIETLSPCDTISFSSLQMKCKLNELL